MLLRLAVVAAVACCTLLSAHDDAKPNCREAGDGYYVKGCSTKFWRCVNDRLYSYDCPKSLYFNPLKRKCEYKVDVQICNDGLQHDPSAHGKVIKASAEFNCTALADGPYKPRDIACSNTFITCFNGMAAEQACPFGQFFHEAHKACDYKDNVPGCLKSAGGSKIGGSIVIGSSCPPLRSGHVDIPCEADEVCQKIEPAVDGRYLCSAPFAVWYGPLGVSTADQWTLAPEGLRCGEDGRWYAGQTVVTTAAVDCTAKKSDMAAREQAPVYGAMPAAPAPPPQRDAKPLLTLNAKAATLNACPGLLTGKESEGIPCDADEVCQGIQRPKNGRYSCEAPFTVYYGPVRGASALWKEAKQGLVCGTDGFWYDAGVKVNANGIDCTSKKAVFTQKKDDDETQGCPSLSTNEREIPCKPDEELCNPILKAVAGKYACPTPYRVWYGPRGGDESLWKQAKDALICKSGSWFDGDVKIDASAVDCTVKKIDCSKLGDGTYNGEPGRCSTHFWQCSNEQAFLYPCPPGLFFDDFSKNCDFKEVVESCGGVRRTPEAATTTTVAPPAADAVVVKKTDCPAVSSDSNLRCRSGEACIAPADPVNQKYLCEAPYTLWFGPKSNSDQWRQASNGIQCKNGRWFNGEEQIAPEAVHCTTPKFACAGKKDGSYSADATKCTAYFWNCAHDDAFLYTCPHGLFFDVDTLSCDYKEVIVACGGVKKESGTPAPELIPASDAVTPAFDCSGKDNGYHETDKCQKKFWNCADGKAFEIDCPEGLVYDGRVQLCQYPLACSADLPATTTTTMPPSTLDHGDLSQKPPLPTTSFDCSTQPDGLYAEKKCHKQYVQCTNGRTFVKECPEGLVYTAFNGNCDYKSVCMNPPATTTAAPTTPASDATIDPSEHTFESYTRFPENPTTTKAPVVLNAAPLLPNCANLENGAHALSRCGVEFFLCWSGEASFSKCADGLVFNPQNSQCDYRTNVLECGAAADATPTTTAAPGYAGPPAPPSPTVAPLPDLFCEGRQDGHFGSGCQSFFYSCQAGQTTKMFCPMGLHYDAASKTCDQRELIVACGGKREELPTPAAAVPVAPVAPYQQPQPVAPVRDIPTSAPVINRFCVGKEDGFYAEGCLPHFYSCQAGFTYKMNCPPALYYDATRKTCDRKEDIVACGGTAPATRAPITPAAAPASTYQRVPTAAPVRDIPVVVTEKFCLRKEDGFYSNGCQNFFYSCQDGVTHKMACPAGLFYDTIKKACDNREDIVACGAAPASPAAAPASPYQTVPTAAPVRDVPVVVVPEKFCLGKEDGFYSNGCQNFFYSCQNGVTHKMACPAGLFYDTIKKACDNREEIVACGAAPTTPAAAPASPYQTVPTAAPVKDIPVVVTEESCMGKEDGFYSNGCATFFFSCQNGVTHRMDCPSGLYYDTIKKACDNKEEVAACTVAPTTPAAAPASTYQNIPTAAPVKDIPIVVTEKFCFAKEDGFYSNGCQSFFYSCQNGVTYKMDCPSGLYYDSIKKACDNRDEIVACGATPTTPAAAPVSPYQTVTTAAPVKDIPTVVTDKSCLGKEDGFYSNGCATFFYSCQNGFTHRMDCPSGLYYDTIKQACDNRDEIVACGAAPVATQAPVTLPAAAPASSSYSRPAATAAPVKDIPAVVTENSCLGKEDGFYSNGCATFFFSCQNGVTHKMDCPSGLYYDTIKSACDNKDEIVACGAAPTTPAAAPASPYRNIPTAAPIKDIPAVVTDKSCLGKEDGFYSNGCATFFYSCQNGVTHRMDCPSGLYYDTIKKACDNRDEIVACGAAPPVTQAPVTLPAAAPASSYYSRPAATVAPVKDIPTVVTDKSCLGKEDGFYSNGCATFFYSCQNGVTHRMDCPAGLYYDTIKSACDNRDEIVACGATPTTPAAAPSSPYQNIPTAAPIKDIPAVVTDKSCLGKEDGFYSNGCATFFYSCQNGVTHRMDCPSGLYYDTIKKACDNRDEIVACGAAPPVTQAPVTLPTAAPASSSYSRPVATVAPVRDVPIEKFCLGKDDAFYGSGCQSFFFSCQNGKTHKMACPSGLFYDEVKKACDNREEIIACGGMPTTAPMTKPADVPAVMVESFCAGKTDGFHTLGCASFFYSCQSGATYKMTCPSGLFYDTVQKMCLNREEIAACGAAPTTTPAAAPQTYARPTTTTTQAPAPYASRPASDAPAVALANFCSGKPDASYGAGCQNFFYMCLGGVTYKTTCSSGLYYDVDTKQCNYKDFIVACGGKKEEIAPVTAAPVSPALDRPAVVENFCLAKEDGFYGAGCATFFYSCQGGAAYKMLCPSGLFYDIKNKACDRKEDIAECGGAPASLPSIALAPSTYSAPLPTAAPSRDQTAIPLITPENFCVGKADGYYANGCVSKFFSCSNGATYTMACPDGLFYDTTKQACDRREQILECGAVKPAILPAPTPAAAPVQPYGQPQQPAPTTAAPVRDILPVAPQENFCIGKADGYYANGCVNKFISCSNGATYTMACPDGLFYDVNKKACDRKEEILECGGVVRPAILPAPTPAAAPVQPYGQPARTTAAPVRDTAPAVPVENFCIGKADGYYANGCVSKFFSCSNGATYIMSCPDGLFYDVTKKACDRREQILECGAVRPAILPAPTPAAAPVQPYGQPAPTTAAPVRDTLPVVPTENFCVGKTDGRYLIGCNSFYYSCTNGNTYKMACPSGLFYDGPSNLCDIKENVEACGGKRPVVAPTAPLARDQPAPPVDKFCNGKADGYYGQGCETSFYSCSNGFTYKQFCPSGLVYDITKKQCNRKEEMTGCGVIAAAPAAPAYSAPAVPMQPAQPAAPAPQYTATPTRAPVIAAAPASPAVQLDNFCSGKSDGAYNIGCSAFYYNCNAGITYKMACPAGLFFEITSKRCEARESVAACGGQQLAQPQQPQRPQYAPAPTVAPARNPVVAAANNFCSGKADGFYGEQGCQNYFINCVNGAMYRQECAVGLFFDVTSTQCEYREKVVACGGVAPAAAPAASTTYSRPAAAPAATTAAPPAYGQATAAPAKDKPVLRNVNDRSCTGQKNGFYGEGCNAFFYSCLDGAAYKMACPTGLFYDLELQSCEYKDNVPNCGGRRPEVTATPSPALDNLRPAPVDSAQCAGKADGIYPAGDCTQEYLSCTAGALVRKEACQPGLIYNEANKMCDYRENVAKCGAVRDTLPTRAPAVAPSANAEYTRPTSRPITRPAANKYDTHKAEQQKKRPAASPTGTCAQADGYYSNGCSSDYTACVNGQSMAMSCPSNLMYSASSQMCDYSDNVPECGGSVPVLKDEPLIPSRPAVTATTPPPVVPVTPKSYAPTEAPKKEVHSRCASRPDGIYSLAPCSQNYVACVDEKATIGLCRDDLYYNTASGLCDWRERNPACTIIVRPTSVAPRSVPTTTPVPTVPTRDVIPPVVERLIRPTVPLGVNPDCSKIADGVYAVNSCSPYYCRCTGGRHVARGTCPVGTVFSPSSRSCVKTSALPSCSVPVTTPAPVVATTQAPALAPTQQQQPNYGVQQAQQQPVYQQQQYGQMQQQPSYSQQYAPSYNTYSSSSAASAPAYASGVYADPSQFCYGKSNGIYGNTCQRSYVICQGGATFGYQCPGDFLFYRERGVCDHPSRLPQCGGPTYGYAPAAAPSYQQQQYSSPY